jgi:coenzyme PQQ synthesis protein D (PqqD)
MPQPFTTPDREPDVAAIATQPEELSQGGDWDKLMRLVPVPHPKIHGVALEGETILFDLRTGRSYRLNPVGTAIWEQCTGTATLHEIDRAVCARLNLSLEQVHDDVVSFVAQWSHDGLLTHGAFAQR